MDVPGDEKAWRYLWPFWLDTAVWRMERRTEFPYRYRACQYADAQLRWACIWYTHVMSCHFAVIVSRRLVVRMGWCQPTPSVSCHALRRLDPGWAVHTDFIIPGNPLSSAISHSFHKAGHHFNVVMCYSHHMPITQLSGFNAFKNLFSCQKRVRGILSSFRMHCSQTPESESPLPSSVSMLHIHVSLRARPRLFPITVYWWYWLTYLFFHIFVNVTISAIPMAVPSFTSSAQSASFVTLLPKYTKESTCSNLSTSTLTSTTLPASVIAFVLLHCLAHYASSHVFISTVLKLLYFFYSYVASKTMSSAYRRLLINFSPTLNSPANPYRAFHVTRSARMVNRQGDNLHPCRTPFLTQNHGDMVLAVLTAACCRYAGSNNSDDNEEERKTSVPYTADVTRTRFLVACRRRARGNLTTRFHMIG